MSGLTRSHLSRLELDDFDRPSAETFLALARALKVHPNDLYQAAGYIEEKTRFRRSAARAAEEAFAKLEQRSLQAVPVLERINCKVSDVGQYSQWGLSQGEEAKVIGLLARGFSLEPEVREGDVILINRDQPPMPGNLVLCYCEEQVQLTRYQSDAESNGKAPGNYHVYGVVVGVNRKLS